MIDAGVRTNCLGCPHLVRSNGASDPALLGEPICTFGGQERRMFWEDITDGCCGHGVSPGYNRPWTNGEVRQAVELRRRYGRRGRWAIRAALLLLRTPDAVRLRLRQSGYGDRPRHARFTDDERREIHDAVAAHEAAERRLQKLARELGLSRKVMSTVIWRYRNSNAMREAWQRTREREAQRFLNALRGQ